MYTYRKYLKKKKPRKKHYVMNDYCYFIDNIKKIRKKKTLCDE